MFTSKESYLPDPSIPPVGSPDPGPIPPPGGEFFVDDEDEFPARPAALAEAVRLRGGGQRVAAIYHGPDLPGEDPGPYLVEILTVSPHQDGSDYRRKSKERSFARPRRLRDSLEHSDPTLEEMRGIKEGFAEEERAVISRFPEAATEDANRHAQRLSGPDN